MAAQNRSRNNRPRQATGRPGGATSKPAASASGSGGGPRRLGNQASPQRSAGAQRRAGRRQGSTPRWLPWAAVALVVVVAGTLVGVKLGGSNKPASTTDGSLVSATGRNPVNAPLAYYAPLAAVSASTFNAVGTNGTGAPFTVTAKQPPLTSGGLPQFVYEGGEFCPYCAIMRWSIVTALDRFGTFKNLKVMASAPTDGDIPTFSFNGATYTSKYVKFTPYEAEDRQEPAQPLQTPPNSIANLYTKYDGNASGVAAAPFNTAGTGIPFLDIGNKYVSSGDPVPLSAIVAQGTLDGGGPGWVEIANGIEHPNSSVGKAISAKSFIAQANYLSAAICSLNGGKPASVCSSPGVQAAMKVLAAAKTVS